MRKLDFSLGKNKGADQLCSTQLISNFVFATWILQFLLFFNLKFKASSCTGRFVSDLVGNPENQFSPVGAHIVVLQIQIHELHAKCHENILMIVLTVPCEIWL